MKKDPRKEVFKVLMNEYRKMKRIINCNLTPKEKEKVQELEMTEFITNVSKALQYVNIHTIRNTELIILTDYVISNYNDFSRGAIDYGEPCINVDCDVQLMIYIGRVLLEEKYRWKKTRD